MNRLYHSSLYNKIHWYIADILMLAIVCTSVAVGGIKMLSPYNILYIGAALFMWMIQMALIMICEKDSKKRKDQYLIGIEAFIIPVVILFLAMGMKY